MAAHRQLSPPHWLPQSNCVSASIFAPVATQLTHQGLRALPISTSAACFLRQQGMQLPQAAVSTAGRCDRLTEVALTSCASSYLVCMQTLCSTNMFPAVTHFAKFTAGGWCAGSK